MFSNIQSFYAIFVKFSTDFFDWNVEQSKQGTNLLSSRLFGRVNCGFQVEKHLELGQRDKKPKKFKLSEFSCSFCQVFDRARGLECYKGSTWKDVVV